MKRTVISLGMCLVLALSLVACSCTKQPAVTPTPSPTAAPTATPTTTPTATPNATPSAVPTPSDHGDYSAGQDGNVNGDNTHTPSGNAAGDIVGGVGNATKDMINGAGNAARDIGNGVRNALR